MKLSKRLRKWRANITTQTPLDYVLMLHEDIMGFADEVKALEDENKKLRELVRDLVVIPSAPAFDCYGCIYDGLHVCGTHGCKLVERARELGIEVCNDA